MVLGWCQKFRKVSDGLGKGSGFLGKLSDGLGKGSDGLEKVTGGL